MLIPTERICRYLAHVTLWHNSVWLAFLMLAFLHVYQKHWCKKKCKIWMWVLPLWHKCAWLALLMLAIVTYVTNNDWSKRKLQNMNVSYVWKQLFTNTYNSLTSQAQFFLLGNLDVVCCYIYNKNFARSCMYECELRM